MGFGATAAHLVMVVSIVSAGATAVLAFWDATDDVDDAHRVREDVVEKKAQAAITVTSSQVQGNRLVLAVENTGGVVFDLDKVVFVVNGEVWEHAEFDLLEIDGATTSKTWLPGDTLDLEERPTPADLWIVTEYGATAAFRN